MGRAEKMKLSLFFLPITPRLRSTLVPIIPLSRSSRGPAVALLTCSILLSKPLENLWRSQAPSLKQRRLGWVVCNRRDAAFSRSFVSWYSGREIKTEPGSENLKDERGWVFALLGDRDAIQYLFRTKKGAIILETRLFQILLSGSRTRPKYFVLLFHKIKNNHIQYTEHGL